MAFFFLVAGLEARREFDMGELRDRRRLALPLVVGLGGMVVPIGIYLAINAGRASASGWGTAMSTDTAFALGMLALVGSGVPDRVRTYLLTFAIVDDVAGIIVIALAYSGHIDGVALGAGLVILAVVIAARARGLRNGAVYLLLGIGAWIAFFSSGVDPVIVGLVMGLVALAYPAMRVDLEQASESFRLFREQPTPELASQARESVRTAISPNDRLQQLFHPWTSYLIVPLFALANAGIPISASFLARAYASPVTLGILFGYVIGKPVGTVAAAWLIARVSRGRIQPPVGWAAVTGAGTIAGIGFIVSLLIASLAFRGDATSRGQSRRAHRSGRFLGADLGHLQAHCAATQAASATRLARHRRDDHRPCGAGRTQARPGARASERASHARRVRRLRMPLLRPGGERRARATG